MKFLLSLLVSSQASVVNFQIEGVPSGYPSQLNTVKASPALSALRTASVIQKLKSRVDAGGYMAEHALLALNDLATDDSTVTLMTNSGVLSSCKKLMQRREAQSGSKNLAGSLIARLTNLPVAAQTTDDNGSLGQLNIVVPSPSRVYKARQSLIESAPVDTEMMKDSLYLTQPTRRPAQAKFHVIMQDN